MTLSEKVSEDQVVVGVIRGASGLHGEVKIEPHTDVRDRFASGSLLLLEGSQARVIRSRYQKNYLIVQFDVVSNRTQAESIFGQFVTVPLDQIPRLPRNYFYHFQLLDMSIYTEDCNYLGNLSEIITTPGNDVYVVKKAGFRDLLLPALSNVIMNVDVNGKSMVVRLLQGLEQVVMKNAKKSRSPKYQKNNIADNKSSTMHVKGSG